MPAGPPGEGSSRSAPERRRRPEDRLLYGRPYRRRTEGASPGGLQVAIDSERRIAELERQLAERTAERDEARREVDGGRVREQAVAGILRLLSARPTDQRAVFRAILEAVLAVNGGGTLFLLDGETLRHQGALRSVPSARTEWVFDGEPDPRRDLPLAQDATLQAVIR